MMADIVMNLEATGNMRAAMEASLGLQNFECTARLHDHELPQVSTFFALADEEASRIADLIGEPRARLHPYVQALNPFDCPSFRVSVALTRAQNQSGQKAVAGDESDRDHAMFLPYVDVAFVDRRTAGFLEQEARRQGGRLLTEDIVHVVRSSAPLRIIEQVATLAARGA